MPIWINLVVGLLSLIIAAAFGIILIPYLRKVKAGSHILEIGPAWHKSKEGTPLMGGFMFVLPVCVASIAGYFIIRATETPIEHNSLWRLILSLGMCLGLMLVGFADDYIKVVKKRNMGFNAKAKTACQAVVIVLYMIGLHLLGVMDTAIVFPIFGEVDFGFFYYPLMLIAIYGVVNAVNFTDGVDGLLGSVTTVYSTAFAIILGLLGNSLFSSFSMAVAGGCLGFLVWNLHPAKVFMGDTGSMFLGGCVVAMGMESGLELLIPLVGIIYIIEALSDVIQIISYKTRKKRVFKMAPIHHHFEMSGWSEYKIVVIFSLVTLVAGFAGILSTYIYLN